jgi:hypothetical protein
MKAPVGSKKEIENQITYVQSVLDWANSVLSIQNVPEKEYTDIIKELKFIQKYKAPTVIDMIKNSKPLLSELNDRYKDLIEPHEETLKAKNVYMAAPVGSKFEVQSQILYVQAVIKWANLVLSKTEASEDELENVIDEMKFIQKYKAPTVIDMINSSKDLLSQLSTKYEAIVEPRRLKIQAKLKGIYDSEQANSLAEASKKRAGNRTKSLSKCAQYVRLALEDAGIIGTEELIIGSAKDLKTAYPKTGVFTQIDIENINDLKLLPPGCIIVWQNGKGYGVDFEKHGHVVITQTDGRATTDYNQKIQDYDTEFTVFVPTLKTTEDIYQDATLAGEDISKGRIKGIAGQSKYLNRCMKYAQSVINDSNASEDMIANAKQLLQDAIKKTTFKNLRPMVVKSQRLLAELKN